MNLYSIQLEILFGLLVLSEKQLYSGRKNNQRIMSMKFLSILVILFAMITSCNAQKQTWNGKSAAVVLTYDDGLNVHLDYVAPALAKNNLKATFYVSGKSSLMSRLDEWKAVAKQGHELGNHTMFHPCNGASKNREWVSEDYDLDNYSMPKMQDEILLANTLLEAVDGKKERTFAYTCGDVDVEGKSLFDFIGENFVGARGVVNEPNKFTNCNLLNINSVLINGESSDKLKAMIDKAIHENTLLVFLFHGVGGEHDLNVDLTAHNELLQYISSKQNAVWNAPLVEVLKYIKDGRN